ncbi:hypothetical protein JCM11251_005214 [Rhodosporidiobolus azoricus]
MRTSLALLALSASALLSAAAPGSEDYAKDRDGKDIFIKADKNKKEKEIEVSLKEVCYRDLYANIEEFKKETEKQIKIKDGALLPLLSPVDSN